MPFDHEKMDVYKDALKFAVDAGELISKLPKGNAALADQLSRASTSIVLNIAEGAGKFAKLDKRRYYQSALGSAAESSSALDLLAGLKLATSEDVEAGKALLESIGGMLVGLIRYLEKELAKAGSKG